MKIQFSELIWQRVFYNNRFHHNVFEQSHEINYDDKFYEYKKGKDSILVSCITHLRV